MTERMSGYGSRVRERPPGWAAGFSLLSGATWARVVGITLAVYGGKVVT